VDRSRTRYNACLVACFKYYQQASSLYQYLLEHDPRVQMKQYAYDVCIVGGLGHIGLPLGTSFAKASRKVLVYNLNLEVADIVSAVKCPL
jgi:hypothetical protein